MKFLALGTVIFSMWSFQLFGQTNRTTIRLDKNLYFNFPAEYKKSDTLGQENFLAKTNFAYIQAVKIPKPQAQITSKKDLTEYYLAFQKLAIDQSNGDLVSDSIIELNDLYGRSFKFENYWNDSLVIQENTIFHVDNSMYLFTYAYFKYRGQLPKSDKQMFFSGIDFVDKNFTGQLTIKRNRNEEVGEFIGYIVRYIIAVAVLLAIILFLLKKYY